MVRPKLVIFALAACLVALPSTLVAQTTADILGRVADTSGAVLPGATITIENIGTKDVRTTTSSATGDYLFTLLPIGTYTVRIEMQGFQSQNAKATLNSGDRVRVDGRLSLGNIEETVLVTGEAPLLQTDTSTLSTLVTEKAVQDLPVVGRNFMRLVQLVPGANEGGTNSLSSGNRPDDRRSTSSVSINGAGDNQNNQLIDGMDNNERAIGTIGVKPSMDAIAEVRVQTNLYSAEMGRTSGGVINIITKSGSNAVHGSLFEFYRNDRFDERDYFATTDPILKQNQYGGSVGGPIVSNRTFFFTDYEGFRSTKGQVNLLNVPTAKMRTGDFSELLPGTVIYDPTTFPRQQFEGNIIPQQRMDPVAKNYMALFPLPTSAGLANNYSSTTVGTQDSHTADGRVDHRFNTDNTIWARYSYNNLDNWTPAGCPATPEGIYPGCLTGTNAGFPGPNKTTAHQMQMNYVRVFNATLIGEFKGGFVRPNIASYPANYGTNLGTKLGLPGVNIDEVASALPIMNAAGFAILGDTQNIPLITKDFTQQYSASMTKTLGSHSLKFGGTAIFREFSVLQSASPNGIWTFNLNTTRSTTGQGGYSMASFLLGYPTTVTRQHTPFEPFYHVNEPGVYVQDDWRTTSWLTVNLGVRYDVFTPFTEELNRLSNLDLDATQVLVAGENGVSRTAGISTDYSNVAPRLGFAATLPASTVVRGGYGMSFFPGNIASFAYMKNAPLFSIYGPVTTLADPVGTPSAPNLFLKDGLPPPVPASAVPSQLAGTFRVVDRDFKSTRTQQFNVQVEKEFWGNVVAAGYVGSRGNRVAGNPNVNLAPIGPGQVDPRRLYRSTLPGLSTINVFMNPYHSRYDAFQLVFQRRFRQGLSFNTHYTRARAKSTSGYPWAILDPATLEPTEEWGLSGNSVPHAWVAQVNYALPWGESLTGFSRGALYGWQVNMSTFWQSGRSFGVTNQTALANTGGGDRPNLIADPILPESERTIQKYFNTAAFASQANLTLGNSPPDIGYGPSQRRLDLSVFKEIPVSGEHRVQVRYEVYNVFNVTNFQGPNGNFGNQAFGTINSTGNAIPRQMQFAVKYLF